MCPYREKGGFMDWVKNKKKLFLTLMVLMIAVVGILCGSLAIANAINANQNEQPNWGRCYINGPTWEHRNRSYFSVSSFGQCAEYPEYNFNNVVSFDEDGYSQHDPTTVPPEPNTWHCVGTSSQASPENVGADFSATKIKDEGGRSLFNVRIEPDNMPSGYQPVGHGAVWLEQPNGGVQMDKRSACEWSENNPNYSYRNGSCVYDIFSDAGCTQLVAQMTVDGNGHAQTDLHALRQGSYWVRENGNAHGTNYLWNGEVGSVYINPTFIRL